MFIVASDLSEAQRETYQYPFSRRNVPAWTLGAVKTVFMDFFRTPKSSMEHPSLRVSGHGGSTSRTFIVEKKWETNVDNGPQTKQPVSKVPLMMKGRVFWTWDDNAYAWQSKKFKDREMR